MFEDKKDWLKYDLDTLTHNFCKTIIPGYESYDDISSEELEQIGEFLTNKFYGKKVYFHNEYGDLILGTLNSISFSPGSGDDYDFDNFYIRIHQIVYCMSYDDHTLSVDEIDEPEKDEETKIRWYKKGKLHEGLEEEYPFIEKHDLISIGGNCASPDDEYINCEVFKRKLNKLLLNQLCEFQEDVTGQDYQDYIDDSKKVLKFGKIIKGVVTKIEVTSWFDYDVTVKFTVDNVGYEVNPYYEVKAFLKEERKRKIGDPKIDPYGEEDWDD